MQASDQPVFESLKDRYLNAILCEDYDTARDIIQERDSLLSAELAKDLSEIVHFFEHKYKFCFERIHRSDDDSYIVHWHETDKKLEEMRTRHFNIWLHEKVQPLINDLPATAKRHGFRLDMLTQSSPGKFSLWMRAANGRNFYFEYQDF